MVVTINIHVNAAKRQLKGNVGKNAGGRSKQLQPGVEEINPWGFFL
jgi:hypothetical protein